MDLFDAYDVNGNGELDYKEFVGGLFNNSSIAKNKEIVKNEDGKKALDGKSKQAYLDNEG